MYWCEFGSGCITTQHKRQLMCLLFRQNTVSHSSANQIVVFCLMFLCFSLLALVIFVLIVVVVVVFCELSTSVPFQCFIFITLCSTIRKNASLLTTEVTMEYFRCCRIENNQHVPLECFENIYLFEKCKY